MSSKKYSIFHVQGGVGKHLAATAVARCIKNNYPDRKLIVVCVYTDIFINLSYVDRVYQLGNTNYFYQNYIQDKDSLIFHHEPYYTTDHIHKKLPLIENWCKLYNLKFNNEKPDLKFNNLQKTISKEVWTKGKKPVMVIHTNGGMLTTDAKPYSWTRDMPENLAQKIVNHYKDKYHIYQVTKLNSPKLDNATHIFATPESSLTLIEFFSILLHSKKRVLIDSCLQHAAAALRLPSTVLWNGTSPKVFGYEIHDNIQTSIPYNFKLPGSYLFDFDFNGNETEYPFGEQEELFDFEQIIQSIDKQ
jgi:hypothetical protein